MQPCFNIVHAEHWRIYVLSAPYRAVPKKRGTVPSGTVPKRYSVNGVLDLSYSACISILFVCFVETFFALFSFCMNLVTPNYGCISKINGQQYYQKTVFPVAIGVTKLLMVARAWNWWKPRNLKPNFLTRSKLFYLEILNSGTLLFLQWYSSIYLWALYQIPAKNLVL